VRRLMHADREKKHHDLKDDDERVDIHGTSMVTRMKSRVGGVNSACASRIYNSG
jgi:hypothetical protein